MSKKKKLYRETSNMDVEELFQVLECELKITLKSAKEEKIGWLGAQSDFMLRALEALKEKTQKRRA